MRITLADVGEFVKTGKAADGLRSILNAIHRVFGWSAERKNRLRRFAMVVKEYKAGTPVKVIESRWGCSRSTISRYVTIAGLLRRPPRGSKGPTTREAVLKDYRAGIKIAKIKATHDVSLAYICKVAKDEGILRNAPGSTRGVSRSSKARYRRRKPS